MNKGIVLILIFGLVIGFIFGFMYGGYVTIKAVSDVASRFMDADLVEQAVGQYNDNLRRCYAPILS